MTLALPLKHSVVRTVWHRGKVVESISFSVSADAVLCDSLRIENDIDRFNENTEFSTLPMLTRLAGWKSEIFNISSDVDSFHKMTELWNVSSFYLWNAIAIWFNSVFDVSQFSNKYSLTLQIKISALFSMAWNLNEVSDTIGNNDGATHEIQIFRWNVQLIVNRCHHN